MNGGGVECWGDDSEGELGDNSSTTAYVPVDVEDVSGGQALATGCEALHDCALAGGHIECWGYNSNGQIGNGTTSTSYDPQEVTGF